MFFVNLPIVSRARFFACWKYGRVWLFPCKKYAALIGLSTLLAYPQ